MNKDRLLKIKQRAATFKYRTDFMKAHYNDYMYAYKHETLVAICSHMVSKRKWTTESLRKEAEKYCSKAEFKEFNAGAYQTAYVRGILNDIIDPFEWTRNYVLCVVAGCDTYKDFYASQPGAYRAAMEFGMLDSITKSFLP